MRFDLSKGNNIRRKVLIVDDEIVNRRLLGFIVSRDYEVIYAENGSQALDLIKQNEKTLSLILLDLMMPELDGYELLKILGADAELKRIPVIVLTSEKSAEVESLRLGAVDFIPKPYDLPDVILARINRSIALAEDNIIINETERDMLTGLYTKCFFYRYCIMHDRYFPFADMDALVININRFHMINEVYGRDYGDRVLMIIAEEIQRILTEVDGLACRADADMFFVYVSHKADYEAFLKRLTDKLYRTLQNSRIVLRVGICENADVESEIEQRFDRANIACGKLRGRYSSACLYYDNALHERELYCERLIDDMDTALTERQFKVFYQPKYYIGGEKPVLASAEALVRWIHPELGFISPGEFIPLFEENGLIHKLDRYVWKEAAFQIARWKEKYGHTVPVSVNVSRIDIYDPELINELKSVVNDAKLSPKEYLLEITESAYTDNSEQIINTVKMLREEGFRVEMDDFGSGYSSLNMLGRLPIDALKLDMGFIKNICTSAKDMKLVQLMLDIAGFLGVPVIAEGVETKEQYELLKKAKCDYIQGYYFSKPVPEEDFNALIEKEKSNA